jgi:hypothetical protein
MAGVDMGNETRVLAFTPSRSRPLYLDRCIKQLQLQTYPAKHFIFLNSPDPEQLEILRSLASHLKAENPEPQPPVIIVGESTRLHGTYLTALAPADLDDYDLFLPIDDDDFYGRRYVEHCVEDFEANRWDFSGCYSHGAVVNGNWQPDIVWKSLGLNARDQELGVPEMMPASYAFSRTALDVIMGLIDDGSNWADVQWRWALCADPSIKVGVRAQTDFVYHRHGANASMSGARGG